jgi:thioredoxin-related protein
VPIKEVIVTDNSTYNVTAYPTLILYDKTGKELARKLGVMEADDITAWLKGAGS